MLSVTPVFVAIFVLLNIVLLFPIGPLRMKLGIPFWGGDPALDSVVRGHGNFIETVPLSLIALGTAEHLGTHPSLIWGCGIGMLTSRIIHYIGMVFQAGDWGSGRFIGTLMTLGVYLVLAVTIVERIW